MMKLHMFFLLFGLVLVVGTAVFPFMRNVPLEPPSFVELRINELDYDQGLFDSAQFIEIINKGDEAANLSDYYLYLVDGRSGQAVVYQTINFPTVMLAPGDYFVVCNSISVINCDHQFTGVVQDSGPAAVALLLSSAVIDTVSYEGSTPSPYTEGSGVGLEDDGTAVMQGIARWPNGEDTNQNNIDFSPRCVTPGLPNVAQDSDCATLFEPVIAVTLTAVPGSIPEPGGVVTLTVRIDNDGLLPVTLETLTANEVQNLNGQGSCQTGQEIAAGGYYSCQYSAAMVGLEGDQVVYTVTATAVDFFNNNATDTGQTAVSVTRRLSWELYLPVVVQPRLYGEPNNSCSEAYQIPLNQTLPFLAEDMNDWYQFDLAQPGAVRIHWLNFVPQEGQILLYRGLCDDRVFVANNGETAVNRVLDVGVQPAGHYYIRIISDALPNDQDEYTLRVQFTP
ncbi:MAG TPA: lamin tail domain-containing protein [Chloroflexota bacterium]|nr:lamin tail domain-containing protein [Chloroflexota bacterium]HUM71182.1 lamin tail domain-containing protein [Chloroflexota bacterium]